LLKRKISKSQKRKNAKTQKRKNAKSQNRREKVYNIVPGKTVDEKWHGMSSDSNVNEI
jgi:hypothetical protein